MGRRFVGFLIGLLISAVAFSVVAVLSREPQRDAVVAPDAAEPAAAAPEASGAEAPVAAAPDDPVIMAEPVEPAPEEPPVVVVDTNRPAVPTPAAAPRPEVADPAADAPLTKPGALTGVAPAPDPVPPVPNPPVKIASADPAPAPAPKPEPDPAPAPATEAPPAAAPEPQATATPEPASEPAPEPEPQHPLVEERAAAPVIRRSRLPVVSDDTSRSAGIRIGRPITSDLPSVTGPATAPEAVPTAPATAGAKRLVVQKTDTSQRDKVAILTVQPEVPQAAPNAPRALDRYGVLFDPGERPVMSIILVDVGNAGVPLNAAATLDLPVTFAVAVDRSDAALAAAAYYENGHEVLALSPRSVELSLSGGQTGEQVADLLTEFFARVPQSVGLLDVPEATLQNDRVLSNQVLAALNDTGHGLVTYEQGLNVVLREAEKAEVPTGLIYRVLDQKGESVEAIARHLDRAATEASRSGHVLVIGSTRAETIQAIQGWAQSRTAGSVTLAPVSASLKQD